MTNTPLVQPLPGMKPITEYALSQLRYRKLIKLHHSQAVLVSPASKVYYLWNLNAFASQRRFEWYSTPQAVLASPRATPAMRKHALMIRNSRNGFTRPPKKREKKIIPGTVEPVEDWV